MSWEDSDLTRRPQRVPAYPTCAPLDRLASPSITMGRYEVAPGDPSSLGLPAIMSIRAGAGSM
jgi:hypothetical protein